MHRKGSLFRACEEDLERLVYDESYLKNNFIAKTAVRLSV